MTSIRTAPPPQNIIIGIFLFLVAIVLAVAPLPILYRSLGILLSSYLAFSTGGMTLAYIVALLAPPVGIISGDANWLIMLPIMLSSSLVAILGLEYAWRYPAIAVSPLLYLAVTFAAWQLSKRELFAIDLPWGSGNLWLSLHALIAVAGVLIAIYIDRRRERLEPDEQ